MTSLLALQVLCVVAAGYGLGAIPFGLLLTRAAGLGDIRSIGSGNIGATNVLRTGNKALAAATLLLDVAKGTLAVLIGRWLATLMLGDPDAVAVPTSGDSGFEIFLVQALARIMIPVFGLAAGLGAFLGHIYPITLGFKGGKGVATYIGVLIGAAWPAALVFAVAWLATAVVTRYSSLSALIATLVVFIFLAGTGGPFVAPIVAVISALLFWKHRDNIKRLIAGTESRIGAKV